MQRRGDRQSAGQFTLKAHKNKAEAVALISIGKGRGRGRGKCGDKAALVRCTCSEGRLEKGLRQRWRKRAKAAQKHRKT